MIATLQSHYITVVNTTITIQWTSTFPIPCCFCLVAITIQLEYRFQVVIAKAIFIAITETIE